MNQNDKNQYQLLADTVIISLETAGYHMSYLSNICALFELKDDSDDCDEYVNVIKKINTNIKKLKKKMSKINVTNQ